MKGEKGGSREKEKGVVFRATKTPPITRLKTAPFAEKRI